MPIAEEEKTLTKRIPIAAALSLLPAFTMRSVAQLPHAGDSPDFRRRAEPNVVSGPS